MSEHSSPAPGAALSTPVPRRPPTASGGSTAQQAPQKRKAVADKPARYAWKIFKNLPADANAANVSNTGGAAGSSPAPVTPQPSAAQGVTPDAAAAQQRPKPGSHPKAASMRYLPPGWTAGKERIGAVEKTNADGSVAVTPVRPWRAVVWPANKTGESKTRLTDALSSMPDGSECQRILGKRLKPPQELWAAEYSREHGYTLPDGSACTTPRARATAPDLR